MDENKSYLDGLIEQVRRELRLTDDAIGIASRELERLEAKRAEQLSVISRLGAPAPAAPSVKLPPEELTTPAARRVAERRGRAGQSRGEPTRLGLRLGRWHEMARREFGDGREFTPQDLADVVGVPDVATPPKRRDAARVVLEELVVRGAADRVNDRNAKPAVYRLRTRASRLEAEVLDFAARVDAAVDERRATAVGSDAPRRGEPVPGTGGPGPLAALNKDVRRVVQRAVAAGWVPTTQGNGHVRFTSPRDPSRMFTAPTTPGDVRTLKNLRQAMRRAGAPL